MEIPRPYRRARDNSFSRTPSFVPRAPFLVANIYVAKYHQNSFLQFYIKIWQLSICLIVLLYLSFNQSSFRLRDAEKFFEVTQLELRKTAGKATICWNGLSRPGRPRRCPVPSIIASTRVIIPIWIGARFCRKNLSNRKQPSEPRNQRLHVPRLIVRRRQKFSSAGDTILLDWSFADRRHGCVLCFMVCWRYRMGLISCTPHPNVAQPGIFQNSSVVKCINLC
jgi:hypothetical protein